MNRGNSCTPAGFDIFCKVISEQLDIFKEAWGRAALREFGALDFLISRLSSTSSNSSDRLAIVQPLRHFVHDTNGSLIILHIIGYPLNCRESSKFCFYCSRQSFSKVFFSGMAFLARNRVFIDTVVKDVKEYIDDNKVVCEVRCFYKKRFLVM